MKNYFLLTFILGCTVFNTVFAQLLIEAPLVHEYDMQELQQFGPQNEVNMHKVLYVTNDIKGNPDTASGALLIPLVAHCDSFPIAVYCHGTQFNKFNVPSRRFELETGLFFASKGYAVMLPDYLGHGDSRGIHPYLHAETEATATLDMIRASREYLTQQSIALNGQVFLSGYSQGGHACMATHKYIEENNLYGEFNVVASVPASGPYDISGQTYEGMFNDTNYQFPGFVPYLLNAMQMAYGNLYNDVSEVYKAPHDAQVQKWLDNTMSLEVLNSTLPKNVKEYVHDSIIQGYNNHPNNRFKVALAKNNVYDWLPTRNVTMYYCEADHLVNYENATLALNTMIGNGATMVEAKSVGAQNDHFDCALPALLSGVSLANKLRKTCTLTGINEISEQEIKIFPNPSNGKIQIIAENKISQLTVYNNLGEQVFVSDKKPSGLIDLSAFDNGIYLMLLRDEKGTISTNRLVIQN